MHGTPVGSLLGKIPHAVRQLSLYPELLSLCSGASSNYSTSAGRVCTLQQEKPPAHVLQLEGRPQSLQLEEAGMQQQTLRAAKNIF